MDNVWTLVIAISIFLLINLLYYVGMRSYVQKSFGQRWLTVWGNKVYFWQSAIFASTAGTAILMYVLITYGLLPT